MVTTKVTKTKYDNTYLKSNISILKGLKGHKNFAH